jgi:uncharacterized protein (UPF0128 family)
MKLIENTNTIEQIGQVTHENEFKMKSSRKAFQILSDLYSDKPLAIVRELGCNASDSMTASGKKDQPFHIHLPNSLEPWVTIQDFGTGISHENIYNIYATYFESTKTNTDDQVGCLGLGSKSPFCYTDAFSVTSIHQGKKSTYNAFFNQHNTPAIALVSKENTTEANGVSIKIPVKKEDFDNFRDATFKAFRFFSVKPTITGGKIEWNIETPMFKGEGWESYADSKKEWNGSYAIMGGVNYPINNYKLDSKYRDMLYKANLVLHFKMGEIDFTPSRESISYCPATIKALNDKLEMVQKDFVKRLNQMLAEKDSIFDALQMVNVLQSRFAYIQGMKVEKMIWKGQDITSPIDYIKGITKSKVTNSVSLDPIPCITYHKPSYYKTKIHENHNPSMDRNVVWYYNDGILGGLTRVRNFVRDNEDTKISLFSKMAYDKLIASGFPAESFKPVSDLPKPQPKARKTRNGQVVQRVKGQFNIYFIGDLEKKAWEGEVYEQHEPKYYIVKNKENWEFSMNVKGLEKTLNEKGHLYRLFEFMGITSNDVVMVADNNVKHLPTTCVEFTKWVNDNINIKIDNVGIATCYHYRKDVIDALTKHDKFKKLPSTNEFKTFINKISDCLAENMKFTKIDSFIKNGYSMRSGNPIKYKGNKVLELIISRVGTYNWSVDEMLLIVENLK